MTTNAHVLFGKNKVFFVDYFHELDPLGGLEDNLYVVRLTETGEEETKLYEWRDEAYRAFTLSGGVTTADNVGIEVCEKRTDLPSVQDARFNVLYIVLSDVTAENKTTMYLRVDDAYTLLAAFSAGGAVQEYTQVTKLGVEATPATPKMYAIDIPRTTNFLRAPIEVLRFNRGALGVVQSAVSFDNGDAADFIPNETVVFDGKMQLETEYLFEMMKDSNQVDVSSLHRKSIDRKEWKLIDKLAVSPTDKNNKTFILHDGEYKKWNEKEIGLVEYKPNMTSNTLPSPYVASSSSDITPDYKAWKAFNGTIKDDTDCWHSTATTRAWLQIDFNTPKKVNKFTLMGRVDSGVEATPSTFYIKGSNDGVTFNEIFYIENVKWVQKEIKTFMMDKVYEYRYYLLDVVKSQNSPYVIASKLEFSLDVESTYGKWTIEQDFLSDGMDSLSPLLDRRVETLEPLPMTDKSETLLDNEVGRVFSKTLNLKAYTDIRKITHSSVNGKMIIKNTINNKYYTQLGNEMVEIFDTSLTNVLLTGNFFIKIPTRFYDEFGDEIEVLYYTDDKTVLEVNLVLEANWSPIDELDGDFEVITYTDEVEASRQLLITAAPDPQLILPIKDIKISAIEKFEKIILNSIVTGRGVLKVILSFDSGETWYTWNNTNFETIQPNLKAVLTSGITPAALETMDMEAFNNLRSYYDTFRMAYAMEIQSTTDQAATDELTFQIEMKGTWKAAVHGRDYDYEYPNNSSVVVTVYQNGDYKMNV